MIFESLTTLLMFINDNSAEAIASMLPVFCVHAVTAVIQNDLSFGGNAYNNLAFIIASSNVRRISSECRDGRFFA